MSELVAVRRGLPGMGKFISREQAERYVRSGMARFTSDAKRKIVFLHCHQRESAEREARAHETAAGYENVHRPLTMREIAAIPVTAPGKLLSRSTKRRT